MNVEFVKQTITRNRLEGGFNLKAVPEFLRKNKDNILIVSVNESMFAPEVMKHWSFINPAMSHAIAHSARKYDVYFDLFTSDVSKSKDNKELVERIIDLTNFEKNVVTDMSLHLLPDKSENLIDVLEPLFITPIPKNEYLLSFTVREDTYFVDGKQVTEDEYAFRVFESQEFWKQHPDYVR